MPYGARLIALLFAANCAGCYTPGPILSPTQPNVIVFRGGAGFFPHLEEFERALVDEGACPTVAYPEVHRRVTERVIAARNTGRLQGPLVIVGYSKGADKALEMSRELGERGIAVDKLVLLEAADGGRVPCNVRECVNIYYPQPWGKVIPYFGGGRVLAENAATHVVNYNVRDFNDGRYDGEECTALTANPFIQDKMVEEVMVAFEENGDEMEFPLEDAGDETMTYPVSFPQDVPPPAEE
jgi:hypothetical protein